MMIVIISDNRIIIISLLSVLALIIFNATLSHIIIHLLKLMQCWFSTSLLLFPRIRTCRSFNIYNSMRRFACVYGSLAHQAHYRKIFDNIYTYLERVYMFLV